MLTHREAASPEAGEGGGSGRDRAHPQGEGRELPSRRVCGQSPFPARERAPTKYVLSVYLLKDSISVYLLKDSFTIP